jgi:Tfp pilus assembly protein PilF
MLKFRTRARTVRALVASAAVAALALAVIASPGNDDRKRDVPSPGADRAAQLYEQGMNAVKTENYAQALKLFEQADKLKKSQPETLNMLAFCQRMNGRVEESRETYLKALKLQPKFPQAREYLGETYLALAKEQLDMLKSYGSEGAEDYEILKQAIINLADEAQGKPIDSTKRKSRY